MLRGVIEKLFCLLRFARGNYETIINGTNLCSKIVTNFMCQCDLCDFCWYTLSIVKCRHNTSIQTFEFAPCVGLPSFTHAPWCTSCQKNKLKCHRFRNNLSLLFMHWNRPFSYSEKECGSNDILLHFVELSNMHNWDRSSNAIHSNLAYKTV